MQNRLLYEYAVIRLVPQVDREEFINVGVILYCGKEKFLGVKLHLDEAKINVLSPSIDISCVEKNLNSFKIIVEGGPHSGPIGQFDLAGRFRWLTATRSTIIQTSKVHVGLSYRPQDCLEKLFEEMVL